MWAPLFTGAIRINEATSRPAAVVALDVRPGHQRAHRVGQDRPGPRLAGLLAERQPVVAKLGARVFEPLVEGIIEDDDAVAGLLEVVEHVDEPARRRVQAVDQADRRPARVVGTIRWPSPHPVILLPPRRLDASLRRGRRAAASSRPGARRPAPPRRRRSPPSRAGRRTRPRPPGIPRERPGQRAGQARAWAASD